MKQSDSQKVTEALNVLDLNDASVAGKINNIQMNVVFNADADGAGPTRQNYAFSITPANTAAWNALNNMLTSWLANAAPAAQTVLTNLGVTRS